MSDDVVEHLHDLRGAADEPYRGAGPVAARARAAAHRRRRRGAVAGALVLIVAAVVVGFWPEQPARLQPAGPARTSSATLPQPSFPATGSASPADREVPDDWRIDWANSIMNLPANDGCPHRRVQFTDGTATFAPWQYSIGEPAYGDFTGDGRDDAVVVVECHGDADVGGPESRWVVAAFTSNERGGPEPLESLYAEQAYVVPVVTIADQVIRLELRYEGGAWQIERYRWDGEKMNRISVTETPRPPR
ncbi:hypothetical protein [Cryptosporangium arvum]|uniref:hypothetical protein n=1 Tax=Cryptosporangium arvum TaxID=80871 RepID=UPI0004B1A9FA|nr:hypothetical protein [Cryptosporangium arvum]